MAATCRLRGPVVVLEKAMFCETLRARATERQSLTCRRVEVEPRPKPKLRPVEGSARAVMPIAAPAATAAKRLKVDLFMAGGLVSFLYDERGGAQPPAAGQKKI